MYVKNKENHLQAGFTFIELVIVIFILGLLMAIAGPSYYAFREYSSTKAAEATVKNLKTAIFQYNLHTGTYPQTLKDLEVRPTDERVTKKWHGPYVEEIGEDPWGNPYVYRVTPGAKNPYELYSNGSKGYEATKEDRIGQWN